MAHDQTVARTILEQLGGRRFIAMTGASSLTSGPSDLSFRLPTRLAGGIGGMRIILTDMDDYRIETVRLKGSIAKGNIEYDRRVEAEGVYCDNLREAFTRITGLATSLGSRDR
jgi:hypothetical protein